MVPFVPFKVCFIPAAREYLSLAEGAENAEESPVCKCSFSALSVFSARGFVFHISLLTSHLSLNDH